MAWMCFQSVGWCDDMNIVSLTRLPPVHAVAGESDQPVWSLARRDVAGQPSAADDLLAADPLDPVASCKAAPGHKNTGFIDLNYYWDTRDFNVMTINAGAKLAHDFEYFQFLNLFGEYGDASAWDDLTSYYTEVNLRRPICKDHDLLRPLDWTAQYADGSVPEGVLRFGVRWRLHDTRGSVGEFFNDVLKLKYSVNLHAIETDGAGWQLEHVYRRDFFDKRVYIAGFADHNIDSGSRNSTWVTENQIGVRLFDQFFAVAEYRYSSPSAPVFKSGWGFGMEYVIRFE